MIKVDDLKEAIVRYRADIGSFATEQAQEMERIAGHAEQIIIGLERNDIGSVKIACFAFSKQLFDSFSIGNQPESFGKLSKIVSMIEKTAPRLT